MSVVPIQRFAVEFDRRVVGIAVRVPGGFMFYSSDDDFEQIDGQLFPRARAISRRLEKISGRRRGPNNQAVHAISSGARI